MPRNEHQKEKNKQQRLQELAETPVTSEEAQRMEQKSATREQQDAVTVKNMLR